MNPSDEIQSEPSSHDGAEPPQATRIRSADWSRPALDPGLATEIQDKAFEILRRGFPKPASASPEAQERSPHANELRAVRSDEPTTPATDLRSPTFALPGALPARMLNEFVYCPRLFYYEHVEGVFVESADTLRGAVVHARVDSGAGSLPPARATSDAGSTATGTANARASAESRRENSSAQVRSLLACPGLPAGRNPASGTARIREHRPEIRNPPASPDRSAR
jgi:hypothetical protein